MWPLREAAISGSSSICSTILASMAPQRYHQSLITPLHLNLINRIFNQSTYLLHKHIIAQFIHIYLGPESPKLEVTSIPPLPNT